MQDGLMRGAKRGINWQPAAGAAVFLGSPFIVGHSNHQNYPNMNYMVMTSKSHQWGWEEVQHELLVAISANPINMCIISLYNVYSLRSHMISHHYGEGSHCSGLAKLYDTRNLGH